VALIIVPFDYKEDSHFSIVPICIGEVDAYGNPIYREWVESGVVPVADELRKIARRVLRDVWRVSELTERVVHSLSRKYGFDLGVDPSLRVLKLARWHAEDLRVGGRRVRRKTEVELFAATLDTLQDQFDLISDLVAKDALDRLMKELDRQGLHAVRDMVPMMLRDCTPDEFTGHFQKIRNTLAKRFYRGMRKAAKAKGITW
jgi:hypothetical protein